MIKTIKAISQYDPSFPIKLEKLLMEKVPGIVEAEYQILIHLLAGKRLAGKPFATYIKTIIKGIDVISSLPSFTVTSTRIQDEELDDRNKIQLSWSGWTIAQDRFRYMCLFLDPFRLDTEYSSSTENADSETLSKI
jgi:hypothetical protein